MKIWRIGISVLCGLFLLACTTTGTPATGDQNADRALKEMTTYYENAQAKMDEIAISEAISQLVAVLAIRQGLTNPSQEILALAKKAETDLTKIEAGLLLQPSAEWVNESMDQIVAQTIAANKGQYLNPAVILMYNVGGSRATVSGAPVFFEFAKGSGVLTLRTVTNEYGQAAAQLGKIDNPNSEAVIHASVKFTVRGYTYVMNSMKRDFVFRPASKRAVIIAVEKAEDFVSDNPIIFSSVYKEIKEIKYDFVPFNGNLLGDKLSRVFNGDLDAIKTLTLEKNMPYLVMVYSDCYKIQQQLSYEGRPMNMYTALARSTMRIIRVVDGKILYEEVVYVDRNQPDDHAQGNSVVAVRVEAFTRLSEKMSKNIKSNFKKIESILNTN
ncbi:MAG: hypothetical protein JW904_03345 [Spirochaetales bacterium]|nr:hypothetical protein [Spirochaetales bacterium]